MCSTDTIHSELDRNREIVDWNCYPEKFIDKSTMITNDFYKKTPFCQDYISLSRHQVGFSNFSAAKVSAFYSSDRNEYAMTNLSAPVERTLLDRHYHANRQLQNRIFKPTKKTSNQNSQY